MEKRGLSDIVTNVLIILLVLVAVSIIWVFLRPVIQQGAGSLDGAGDSFSIFLEIVGTPVIETNNQLSLIIKRNAGPGDLEDIAIILEDANGATTRVDATTIDSGFSLNELESKALLIDPSTLSLSDPFDDVNNIVSVSIAPIIQSGSGPRLGTIADTKTVGSGSIPITTLSCGDGSQDDPEECDDGNSELEDGCDTDGANPYGNGQCTLTFCGDTIVQETNGEGKNEICDANINLRPSEGNTCDYDSVYGTMIGIKGCNSRSDESDACKIDAACTCFIDYYPDLVPDDLNVYIEDLTLAIEAIDSGADYRADLDCNEDGQLTYSGSEGKGGDPGNDDADCFAELLNYADSNGYDGVSCFYDGSQF